MKKAFIIFFVIIFQSCSNKNGVEIEILNNELISNSSDSKNDTLNIINFKITNKSNDIYYINNLIEDDKLIQKSAYKEGKNIRIFNFNDNEEVNYITMSPFYLNYPSKEDANYSFAFNKRMVLNSKRLGYKQLKRFDYSKGGYTNFFIHPNETLFFEYYINLTDTIANDDFRLGYPIIKKGGNYYAKLSIASDSSNYKNDLPRYILETIKENKVKVYHGIIESKNEVPIKVIN
jgi:hypothetical protein